MLCLNKAFGDFHFQSGCRVRVDADRLFDLAYKAAIAQL